MKQSLPKQPAIKKMISQAGLVIAGFASVQTNAQLNDVIAQLDSPIAQQIAQSLTVRYETLQNQGCVSVIDEGEIIIEGEGEGDGGGDGDGDGNGVIPQIDGDVQVTKPTVARATLADVSFSECSGRALATFTRIEELIHSTNGLASLDDEGNNLPTFNSLNLSITQLNEALQYFAAEEYAALGDMSRNFLSQQARGLSGRTQALRNNASGFSVGLQNNSYNVQSLKNGNAYGEWGGAAGSDITYSKWGGFLNVQFSDGSRKNSGLENAFDFSSVSFNAGADYRINNEWVAGINFSYTDQEVEFDPRNTAADGNVNADGLSLMPFVLFQKGNYFASFAVGSQSLNFDADRAIIYNTVNTQAQGNTDGSVDTVFFETGYSFMPKNFIIEPFLSYNSSDVSIDAFVEEDVNNEGFNLSIQQQKFDFSDTSLGVRMSANYSYDGKIISPYFNIEAIKQNENDARSVTSNSFAGAQFTDSAFELDTEKLDSSYQVFTLGVSSVLRGSSEKEVGGISSGDIQGFVELQTVEGFTNYSLTTYRLGLRMSL